VVTPHMYTVYFGQVYRLRYISIPPPLLSPFFKQRLVGLIMMSSYVHI
jgi:hypothetical protein